MPIGIADLLVELAAVPDARHAPEARGVEAQLLEVRQQAAHLQVRVDLAGPADRRVLG